MLEIIMFIAILVISLLIVIKAADLFVDNLVAIGGAFGISEIILGVTASAIGTSLPEFGSAMIATLTNSPDLGVGVVIGSNIWNIAGILGITAAYVGLVKSDPRGLTRDGAVTLITALILMAFMFMGSINKFAGIVMIAVYCVYLWILVKDQKKESKKKGNNTDSKVKEELNDNNEQKSTENTGSSEKSSENLESSKSRKIDKKTVAWTLVGLAGLIVGCRLLVYSGVELATIAGVPTMIMGLFTLAIGTSIPELVVTLSSAMKGLHDLSIGNILGSNTFNIMIGIGIPALFMNIPVEPLSLTFDAPVMILVTILVLLLIKRGMKLTRRDGIILMATYIAYAYIRLFVLA